jgi:hypothetical protein
VDNLFLYYFVLVLVMGAITGVILEKKGYNPKEMEYWSRLKFNLKWGLLSAILPPLAPLIALSMGPNPEKFGKCPYCRSIIELGATVCPHCGRDITTPLSLIPEYQAFQQMLLNSQKPSTQQASQQTTSTSPDISQQQTTHPKPQIQITPTLGLKEKKRNK